MCFDKSDAFKNFRKSLKMRDETVMTRNQYYIMLFDFVSFGDGGRSFRFIVHDDKSDRIQDQQNN
jgi:hypothetical protein